MGSSGKGSKGGFIRGFEASTHDEQAGGTNTWILSHNKAFQVLEQRIPIEGFATHNFGEIGWLVSSCQASCKFCFALVSSLAERKKRQESKLNDVWVALGG